MIDRQCCGAIPLRVNTESISVFSGTLPGHDEIARGVHGDCRDLLIARSERVDPEFASDVGTTGAVNLSIDAIPTAVLVSAIPCHNKVPSGIHRDRGSLL